MLSQKIIFTYNLVFPFLNKSYLSALNIIFPESFGNNLIILVINFNKPFNLVFRL